MVKEGSTAEQPAAVGFDVQVVRLGSTVEQPDIDGLAVHWSMVGGGGGGGGGGT